MMKPIRLWRWQDRMGVTGATTWHDVQHDPSMAEYAALPRADFDALVKERNAATARAERAERERDEAIKHIRVHLVSAHYIADFERGATQETVKRELAATYAWLGDDEAAKAVQTKRRARIDIFEGAQDQDDAPDPSATHPKNHAATPAGDVRQASQKEP